MIEEIIDDEGTLFEHYRYLVDKGQSAMRIDRWLFNKLVNISRNKIQEAAEAGNILVNEKPVKSNYKVRPEDVVTIVFDYPPREIEIIAEDIPLDIVYEDDDLLIINKKPGMVVHPSYGHYSGTLVNALAFHLKNLPLFDGDDPRPGLVHRIDKNTSGIILIAKSEEAKTHLSKQFFDRTINRRYIALVWRKIMHVFPDGEYGKHAVTHYKVIEEFDYVTMIECKLETGRTHQIRAHMAYIRHPLFNDDEYGGDQILKGTTFTKYKQFVQNCFTMLPRQALHAKSLEFIHPRTGETMFFDSELPKDMADTIEKWRNYIIYRKEEIE